MSDKPRTVRTDGPPPWGMIDIDVSDIERLPTALVAAFDFLGFKHMMQTADDLWRLAAQAKIVLELIRATGEQEAVFTYEGQRSVSAPFVLHVSDTVIFVAATNRAVDILQFLWNAHQVMFYSIQAGMPLRGALCTGEILVSRERRLFLGPAVLEALTLEHSQEWSGACLSRGLVDHIRAVGLAERLFPLVVPYPVPWKPNTIQRGADYALNWIADSMSFVAPDFLPTKFPERRTPGDLSVERKIANSQAFLQHIVDLRRTQAALVRATMKRRTTKERQFAVCVCNTGYPASLELRKIYQVLPDADGAAHGLIRVIDESGEDYLYPEKFFMPIDLPHALESAVRRAAG